jgi:cytochrome c-type biogenesis protein
VDLLAIGSRIEDVNLFAYLAAFGGGIVSFLSPCVLPLVPAYLSIVTGLDVSTLEEGSRVHTRRIVATTSAFVAGFGAVWVPLGLTASALGQTFGRNQETLTRLSGALLLGMSIFLAGSLVVRAPWLYREHRFHPRLGRFGAAAPFVAGAAFAFGWTPCIGPILGAILTASAASATMGQGIALLTVYAAGLGFPFLLAAAFTESLTRRIRTIGRLGRRLYQLAGVVMILMGIAMITGELTAFSYWLLETIPVLGRIG